MKNTELVDACAGIIAGYAQGRSMYSDDMIGHAETMSNHAQDVLGLIAQKQVLLEALMALHEYTRTHCAAYRNGLGETDPLYSTVCDSIAKATGGQS